jgi:dihydrofolate reductase
VISLIVAMDENGVIGREGRLPWRQPADLMHFKVLTMGKPILMGRKTFDSIGKPLPGRTNLVLTRDAAWAREGAIPVRSLDDAVERSGEAAELMVIGGAEVFRLALPRARRIYLTRIHAKVQGDTHFPPVDWSSWREVERQAFAADEKHAYGMTFLTLDRAA